MKKRVGALVVAVVALTAGVAMAVETGGRPWALIVGDIGTRSYNELYKVCDQGRAVYILTGFDYGSIAVAAITRGTDGESHAARSRRY